MATPTITLFGIANCDTIKKTRRFLDAHRVEYHFHDYKKAGLDDALAAQLCANLPQDILINKRGTTWRKLSAAQQQSLDEKHVKALIMSQPSLVRRPILRHANGWIAGYDETQLLGLA